MIAVIFEAQPHAHQLSAYLDAAARLRPLLERFDGFISIERFESLASPGKIMSLSYWRDAEAVRRWRNVEAHRSVQRAGRESVFADYRLHVAEVIRSYGMTDRAEAPEDSQRVHDAGGREDGRT
jgi:heme-degrading monooxygenase HmoA